MPHQNKYPFAKNLLHWYKKQGRKNLPWREKISAYRVWLSEIMLQQTQVKTVIPYFERFIQRFPTVIDLAQAPEDEVLHLWTGLGYYARARNLHHAAKQIVQQLDGKFPHTQEGLESLPGIGRSTAAAILAISYGKKAAILDGNVKRVLARFCAIEGFPGQTKVTQQLWNIAENFTPTSQVANYTQAIMDFGATICIPKQPRCDICPVNEGCEAYRQKRVTDFPQSKPKKTTPIRQTRMLIVHDQQQNQVLLEKRPPLGIWGGLWSFPECNIDVDIHEWCEQQLNLTVKAIQTLPTFKHVFSHFQLHITPIHITKYRVTNRIMDSSNHNWYCLKQQTARGFSAPVKRLLQGLKQL